MNVVNETYHKVTADGIERVSVTRERIALTDSIMKRYAQDMPVRIDRLFDAAIISTNLTGSVGVSYKEKSAVFTVRIARMPLRARFVMEGDVLVPDFRAENEIPPMDMLWTPPSNMVIFWMVAMLAGESTSGDQFLVAMDNAGRTYRLPVSNCYENARLCSGRYDGSGRTHLEALIKGWRQFERSDWQSDLVDRGGAGGMKSSKMMFRFKPLEKEGFEQLPIQCVEGDWVPLVTKIANEFINSNIIL